MKKLKLAYIWSLRNAAADSAGQYITYKGDSRYMKSPLEFLVETLNQTDLGERYALVGIIHDDDIDSEKDRSKIAAYGFSPRPDRPWLFPADLKVDGTPVQDLMHSVPSTYRALALTDPLRKQGKRDFEQRLLDKLLELQADVVVLDGLLVILDDLVRPGSHFYRRIFNVHPGITRLESPYERRGAYATLDALHGARGQKIVDWQTMKTQAIPVIDMTGASFHYVDNGIDSGEVVIDVLATPIAPEDTILELRWNNFQNSLFPALQQGLMEVTKLHRKQVEPEPLDA